MKANNKKTIIYLAAFCAFFGAGLYGFFRGFGPVEENNTIIGTPPTISINFEAEENLLQGRLTPDQACRLPGYEFTTDAVNNYARPQGINENNKNQVMTGDHLYYAQEDLTVQEIINHIVPVEENKIMLAYHSNGGENLEKGFYLYPPVAGDVITIDNPSSFTIPANEGFILISCKETEIYKVRNEQQLSSDLPVVLENLDQGWVLVPKTNSEIKNSLSNYQQKIVSIWPQTDAGMSFSKEKRRTYAETNDEDFSDHKMMWLQIKESEAVEDENNDQENNVNEAEDAGENNNSQESETEDQSNLDEEDERQEDQSNENPDNESLDEETPSPEENNQEITAPTNFQIRGYSGNINVTWDYEGELNLVDHFALEYQDVNQLDIVSTEVDPQALAKTYDEIKNLNWGEKKYIFRIKTVGLDGQESEVVEQLFGVLPLPGIDNLITSQDSVRSEINIQLEFFNDSDTYPGLVWSEYQVLIYDSIDSRIPIYNYQGTQSLLTITRDEMGLGNNSSTIYIEAQNLYNYGESPVLIQELELEEILEFNNENNNDGVNSNNVPLGNENLF